MLSLCSYDFRSLFSRNKHKKKGNRCSAIAHIIYREHYETKFLDLSTHNTEKYNACFQKIVIVVINKILSK